MKSAHWSKRFCGVLTPKRRVGSPLNGTLCGFVTGGFAWNRILDRLTGTCLCIQHLPIAWSPDLKTVGASFSPLRSAKYLWSARTINFWSSDECVFVWVDCHSPRFDWPTPTMWPTVIDVPAMQQKFLSMLVWWRVYWSKWTKRRLYTT